MGILTQRVEIFSDSDPLNSTFVDIPVHKGEKIMCHEPYVVEAMKMYAKSCSDDVLDAIAEYERLGKFRDVREGHVTAYDDKKSTANISLSQKHSVAVDINTNERVSVGDKIDVVNFNFSTAKGLKSIVSVMVKIDGQFYKECGKGDGIFGANTDKWTKKFQEEVMGKGQGDGAEYFWGNLGFIVEAIEEVSEAA